MVGTLGQLSRRQSNVAIKATKAWIPDPLGFEHEAFANIRNRFVPGIEISFQG